MREGTLPRREGEYYGGKITRVNADGSCAIMYDDGDRELRVKPEHIKCEGGGGGGRGSGDGEGSGGGGAAALP